MVVTLGHRHRLMAGEVVDLLDGDGDLRLVEILPPLLWGVPLKAFIVLVASGVTPNS